MIDLKRNIDLKTPVAGWCHSTLAFVRQICTRKPKSPSDEPLSNYRYYEAYKAPSNDPTLPFVGLTGVVESQPCIMSGMTISAPKPPTIPWFLSGVPEQYHKHYTEWMYQQPSGAPVDYNTYAICSGLLFRTGEQNPRDYR